MCYFFKKQKNLSSGKIPTPWISNGLSLKHGHFGKNSFEVYQFRLSGSNHVMNVPQIIIVAVYQPQL